MYLTAEMRLSTSRTMKMFQNTYFDYHNRKILRFYMYKISKGFMIFVDQNVISHDEMLINLVSLEAIVLFG